MNSKKFRKSIFSLLLAGILCLGAIPLAFAQAEESVSNFTELLEALNDPDVATIQLSKTIEIATSITIEGNGKTIYPANESRHLSISGVGTVTIRNLMLKGNFDPSIESKSERYKKSSGGIETAAPKLILENVTIQNCANYNGGAVYAQPNTSLIVTDCDFSWNSGCVYAEQGCLTLLSGSGGAIYSSGHVLIDGETAIRNNIAKSGGGICAVGADSLIEMKNGFISLNTDIERTLLWGGGIESTGDFAMIGGEICDNSAWLGGGGIICSGNTEISGGVIDGNSAIMGGGVAVHNGLDDEEAPHDVLLTVSGDAVISNNTAGLGGGIAAGNILAVVEPDGSSLDTLPLCNLVVKGNAQIKDNTAHFMGGGIAGTLADISVSAGEIHGNTAQYGGGIAVFANGEIWTPSETGEINPVVIPAEGSLGISGGSFSDNTANQIDGATDDACGNNIFSIGLERILLYENETTNDWEEGSDIYLPGFFEGAVTYADFYGTEDDRLIYQFSFTGKTELFFNTEAKVVSDFEELKDALADSRVREILITEDIQMEEVLLINHSVTLRAANDDIEEVVLFSAPDERHFLMNANKITLTFDNVILNGNGDGGGIRCTAGDIKIVDAFIENCYHVLGGSTGEHLGAALLVDSNTNITLDNTNISYNTASYGGAIAVLQNGILLMEGGELTDNAATAWGGGVYISGPGEATFRNVNISGNQAAYGGGIFGDVYGSAIVINGGELNGNYASESGGGIFTAGSLHMRNATVANNTAEIEGGGIYGFANSFISLCTTQVQDNAPDDIAAYGDLEECSEEIVP